MPTVTKPNVTPLYALAGAGDLAVEKLRVLSEDLTTRVVALKDQPLPYQTVQTELNKRFEALSADAKTVPAQLRELPNTFQSRVNTVVEQAEATYDDLAGRGKDLVTRIRKQQATEDLIRAGDDHRPQGQGHPDHRPQVGRRRPEQREGHHHQRPQDRQDRGQGHRRRRPQDRRLTAPQGVTDPELRPKNRAPWRPVLRTSRVVDRPGPITS